MKLFYCVIFKYLCICTNILTNKTEISQYLLGLDIFGL